MVTRYPEFRVASIGAACGLGIVILSAMSSQVGEFKAWKARQDYQQALKNRTEMEQVRVEQTQKLAEIYQDSSALGLESLMLPSYSLSGDKPPMDWMTNVDPEKRTIVYDRNGLCIGYALQGTFYFVHEALSACEL